MLPRSDYVVLLVVACWWRLPNRAGVFAASAEHQNDNNNSTEGERSSWNGTTIDEDMAEYQVRADLWGGSLADTGRYPAFAIPDGSNGLCGSVLIAPDFLLTAAHCGGIFQGNAIYLGGNLRDGSDAVAVGYAEREIQHPDFEHNTDTPTFRMINDIMLVQLQTPIHDIAVATWNTVDTSPVVGTILKAIGFGKTENNVASNQLLEVELQTTLLVTCSIYYPNVLNGEQMLCAGRPWGVNENRRTCSGDSGGPLFSVDANNSNSSSSSGPVVFGLTSFGTRSADNTCSTVSPSVFTRVSHYDVWIRETVCALSNQVTEEFCNGALQSPTQPPLGLLGSIWMFFLGLLS